MLVISDLGRQLSLSSGALSSGHVISVSGAAIFASIPRVSIGDICEIELGNGDLLKAQAVAFREEQIVLAPFGPIAGLHPRATIRNTHRGLRIPVSDDLIGRIVGPLCEELSVEEHKDMPPIRGIERDVHQPPPSPLSRAPIREQLVTGIRTIDALCPIGIGQRMGLFAEAGLGKSTLLSMIAANSEVDLNVIALVGERGREVQEFVSEVLGTSARTRSIIVAATSDESPMRRLAAALTATTIAEYFRDRGKRVLLLVDSLTRVARALREISLASGEIPIRQGYTSSVYTELPALLERTGATTSGSITAIYTLLTNSERDVDPLSEEVKSLLDGHLVLGHAFARRGIYPAIDPLQSVSRVESRIFNSKQSKTARLLRSILSRLQRDRDLIALGAVADAELQACLKIEPELLNFLSQEPHVRSTLESNEKHLRKITDEYDFVLREINKT